MFGLFNKDSSPVTPAAPTIPVTPTVTPTTTPEPELSEFDKITNLLYPKKNGEDSKILIHRSQLNHLIQLLYLMILKLFLSYERV